MGPTRSSFETVLKIPGKTSSMSLGQSSGGPYMSAIYYTQLRGPTPILIISFKSDHALEFIEDKRFIFSIDKI